MTATTAKVVARAAADRPAVRRERQVGASKRLQAVLGHAECHGMERSAHIVGVPIQFGSQLKQLYFIYGNIQQRAGAQEPGQEQAPADHRSITLEAPPACSVNFSAKYSAVGRPT